MDTLCETQEGRKMKVKLNWVVEYSAETTEDVDVFNVDDIIGNAEVDLKTIELDDARVWQICDLIGNELWSR